MVVTPVRSLFIALIIILLSFAILAACLFLFSHKTSLFLGLVVECFGAIFVPLLKRPEQSSVPLFSVSVFVSFDGFSLSPLYLRSPVGVSVETVALAILSPSLFGFERTFNGFSLSRLYL